MFRCGGLIYLITFVSVLGLTAGSIYGGSLIQDDFESDTVDLSKWQLVNGPDVSITQSGGQIYFDRPALQLNYLATAGQFDPVENPLTITGSVTLASDGDMDVWTRANIIANTGGGPEHVFAIAFSARYDELNVVFGFEACLRAQLRAVLIAESLVERLIVVIAVPIQVEAIENIHLVVRRKLHVDHEPARLEDAVGFGQGFRNRCGGQFVQEHGRKDHVEVVVREPIVFCAALMEVDVRPIRLGSRVAVAQTASRDVDAVNFGLRVLLGPGHGVVADGAANIENALWLPIGTLGLDPAHDRLTPAIIGATQRAAGGCEQANIVIRADRNIAITFFGMIAARLAVNKRYYGDIVTG